MEIVTAQPVRRVDDSLPTHGSCTQELERERTARETAELRVEEVEQSLVDARDQVSLAAKSTAAEVVDDSKVGVIRASGAMPPPLRHCGSHGGAHPQARAEVQQHAMLVEDLRTQLLALQRKMDSEGTPTDPRVITLQQQLEEARTNAVVWRDSVIGELGRLMSSMEDVESDLVSACTLLRGPIHPVEGASTGADGSGAGAQHTTPKQRRGFGGIPTSPRPPSATRNANRRASPGDSVPARLTLVLSPAARMPAHLRVAALIESARGCITTLVQAGQEAVAEWQHSRAEVVARPSAGSGAEAEAGGVYWLPRGGSASTAPGRDRGDEEFTARVVCAAAMSAAATTVAEQLAAVEDRFVGRVEKLEAQHQEEIQALQESTAGRASQLEAVRGMQTARTYAHVVLMAVNDCCACTGAGRGTAAT